MKFNVEKEHAYSMYSFSSLIIKHESCVLTVRKGGEVWRASIATRLGRDSHDKGKVNTFRRVVFFVVSRLKMSPCPLVSELGVGLIQNLPSFSIFLEGKIARQLTPCR